MCLHPVRCLKGQRWSTVAASVVSTGAIGPSVHPPDEAPAGLSLSSQRVRLMLITSTQRSVPRSCWVVFFHSVCLIVTSRPSRESTSITRAQEPRNYNYIFVGQKYLQKVCLHRGRTVFLAGLLRARCADPIIPSTFVANKRRPSKQLQIDTVSFTM